MRYGPQAPIVAGILIQTTGLVIVIVIAGIRRVLIDGATAALSSPHGIVGAATAPDVNCAFPTANIKGPAS